MAGTHCQHYGRYAPQGCEQSVTVQSAATCVDSPLQDVQASHVWIVRVGILAIRGLGDYIPGKTIGMKELVVMMNKYVYFL